MKCEIFISSRSGLFNIGTIDILDWIILWCGRLRVHRRIFNSIPSLYPLDAISTLPHTCDNQKCLQTLPNV